MKEKLIEEFKQEFLKKGIKDVSEEILTAEFEAFMKKKMEEMKATAELDEEMLEMVSGGAGAWFSDLSRWIIEALGFGEPTLGDGIKAERERLRSKDIYFC